MNFANGPFDLTSVVRNQQTKADTTFGAAVQAAETVRLNPLSTSKQLKDQREILQQINNHEPE